MPDLSTKYLGLELKNPLVIASCGLTTNLQGIKNCASAGAGAIVLKSLFEEQINADVSQLVAASGELIHAEALEYLEGYGHASGSQEYIDLVRVARYAVDVPIIASINCISADRWVDYAFRLADAGAAALEINIGFLANSANLTCADVESRYEDILAALKALVDIPIALKIGPYFSSFGNLAERLGKGDNAAEALVLFNRFYRLDIDVDKLEVTAGNPYSSSEEIHTALRWMMLLSGKLDCDLAATTGIHSGRDVAKQLLAGATVTQVCSAIYNHGFAQVGNMLAQLKNWMIAHDFETLDDFRGRLRQADSSDPESYERLQYILGLTGIE